MFAFSSIGSARVFESQDFICFVSFVALRCVLLLLGLLHGVLLAIHMVLMTRIDRGFRSLTRSCWTSRMRSRVLLMFEEGVFF